MMPYDDLIREIESRGVMPARAPNLENTRAGLRRLCIDLDPGRVVVVAGTNGKGSVCVTLERLLLASGKKVGLYTSPHLVDTTERIRLQGRDISRAQFVRVYSEIAPLIDDLLLTHFEILTLMAAWCFYQEKQKGELEWAIFEVGLGGTWDATNAIPHSTAVITSLGLDHQNLLGVSLTEIARNKFGIVTSGALVVHSKFEEELLTLAREVRLKTSSRWVEAKPVALDVHASMGASPGFFVRTPWGCAEIVLPGLRGAENTAVALTVFSELGFDPAEVLGSLCEVHWPGRMERVKVKDFPCPVYLSGDHNPSGVFSLVELLKYYPRRRLHVLAGVGRDKDLNGILSPLFSLPDATVYLTETPFRGRSVNDYGRWLQGVGGAWADPRQAIREISRRAGEEDLLVVTGSLYLVGEVRKMTEAR